MKISDFLLPERVICELKQGDRQSVLKELVQPLKPHIPGEDETELLTLLDEREQLSSTGIGGGVALPHVKLNKIGKQFAVFGRSTKGIEFAAVDGQPARLFFLLVAPPDQATLHLKALAMLSRLLRDGSFCKKLLQAGNAVEIYREIVSRDQG